MYQLSNAPLRRVLGNASRVSNPLFFIPLIQLIVGAQRSKEELSLYSKTWPDRHRERDTCLGL